MAHHHNDPMQEQHSHDEEFVKRIANKLEVASKSPERNNLHIIARGELWIIKREGAQKAHRILDTRSQAIQQAKEMMEKGIASSIIIHNEDGTVARSISG